MGTDQIPMPPAPKSAATPSEPDEEQILRDLYGPPDADGIYRGTAPDDGEDGPGQEDQDDDAAGEAAAGEVEQ